MVDVNRDKKVKRILFYGLEKYVPLAFSIIITLVLGRLLPIHVFGELNYLQSIIGVLAILSLESLDQLVQREIINNKKNTADIINTALTLKIIVLIVSFILLYLIYEFVFPFDRSVFILFFIVISGSFNVVSSIYICNDNYVPFIKMSLTTSIVVFLLRLLLVFKLENINMPILACIFSVEPLIKTLVYMVCYHVSYKFRIKIDMSIFTLLIKEGKYLVLSGFVLLIYANLDKLIIGHYFSESEMANYGMAYKFISLYLVMSTTFNIAFVSRLNKLNLSYNKDCKCMLISSAIIGLGFSVANSITTPLILSLVYGDKFIGSYLYVYMLSPLIFLSFLVNATGRILILERLTRHAFTRNLVSLIAMVVACYLLVSKYEVTGVILSSILSYAISSVLYLCVNKETRFVFKGILCS